MAEAPKPEAAETEEPRQQGWWQTVPGFLTAVAGIITAVAGLLVALHQAGSSTGTETLSAPEKPAVVAAQDKAKPAPGEGAAQHALMLPAGMEEKLYGGSIIFTILAARLEPFNTENRALKFAVRCTNNGRYGYAWGTGSFRLLVDGVPRAPTNLISEPVDSQSAKEGDIVFEVPSTASKVVLQIGDPGQETATIPFDLKSARP